MAMRVMGRQSRGGSMTWTLGCGLSMELDVGASILALDAFRARVTTIAGQTGHDTLIAGLFGGGRSGSGGRAFTTSVGSSGGRWFFCCVTFVYMAREQVASGELISAVLAFVWAVARV